MIFIFFRTLLFQVLLLTVAMIEFSFAIPFITITLFLLQIRSLTTTWFYVVTALTSLVIAAIFMQTWLVCFLFLISAGIIFRANPYRVQTSLYKVMLLIFLTAVMISLFSKPTIAGVFVLHSVVSFLLSIAISWHWFSLKASKLRWNDVRFRGSA